MERGLRLCLRGAFAALLTVTVATALCAEPAGPSGDEPLEPGRSVVFSRELPPPAPVRSQSSSYLRATIVPLSGASAPLRVLFEKEVDRAKLGSGLGSLRFRLTRGGQPIEGSFSWAGPKELRFQPRQGSLKVGDGVWVELEGDVPLAAGGSRLVSVREEFEIEEFHMGSKVSSTPVVGGSPRFVAFLDSNTRKIGRSPLYVLYDQPVDPAVLGPRFSASLSSGAYSKLPLSVYRPERLEIDAEGLYDPANVLAVSLASLPPDGSQLRLSYPVGGAEKKDSMGSQAFVVFTHFAWSSDDLESIRGGAAARLESRWDLQFNSSFDPEAFEAAFSISPRPASLDFSFGYDSEVRIRATFDVGRSYTVKLDPAFKDNLGNGLVEPLAFSFRSQDLTPLLELPAYTLLLETGSNRLPVKLRNLEELRVDSYRFPSPSAFIAALSTHDTSRGGGLSALPSVSVRLDDKTMNAILKGEFGIGKEPGLKLVEVRGKGRGTESSGSLSRSVLLQTSDLGVSAKVSDGAVFVWVTRLSSASPVGGATVTLHRADGSALASATTAADGVATLKSPAANGSELGAPLFLSAASGADVSVCRLVNEELSGAWQFDLPGAVKGSRPLAAALFTERGAYRPGESVHIKAFVRPLPEYRGLKDLVCAIRDPKGQEVFRKSAALDPYGGAAWSFATAPGAAVGDYSIDLMLGDNTTSAVFHVEEYRVPTFQVSLDDSGMSWTNEGEVIVKASASYFKGGALGGRPVTWRVYRQPADYAPPGFPGYVFYLDRDLSAAGTVVDEEGSLDSQGAARLSFSPSHPDSFGPMTYIVQASVTDSDQQNYAGRTSKTVHATDLYVGLRPPAHSVVGSGERLSFPAVVVDLEGKAVPGRKVRAFLDTLSYEQSTMIDASESARTYNREVVSTRELEGFSSDSAPVEYGFSVGAAGAYRLRLETVDQRGHTASTGFAFTASGGEAVAWPRFDRERVELLLDKKSYEVGDTASLVVQTPFKEATGLLTVEANGVLDHYPFTIKGDTPSVRFPVKAAYVPNAYVSVILLRGRTHYAKDATGFETGAPAYRIGYARLEVDPAAERLETVIESEKITASPGQWVGFSFSLKDAMGRASQASAAVMVVDEAVLGLTSHRTPDPVALAYAFRVLAVRNASNLLDLPYSRRSRFEKMFPGGDSDLSAILPVSDDLLRKLFKSTAFYDPALLTGADGVGRVSFKLPDNLTTYRIMVVAADKVGRMGSAQAPLYTRKAFAVEPSMPRFVYEGDELTIHARLFNSTEKGGEATVKAAFSGLELVDGAMAGPARVEAGSQADIAYRVRVAAGASEAKVRYLASMGSLEDAVEYSIPIRVKGDKRTSTANAVLQGSGSVSLDLPRAHSPGTVELVISQTPLSELKDSVQYLMGYPNGCIEQTTSTAYPLVVLKDLLPAIGVQVDMADLKAYSEAGVARILSFQTKSGGLSYWPGGTEPHAFATAFGLTALIEAKKRGYNVPDAALKGMGDYLEYALSTGKITGEMPHMAMADADTKALFVMTLGRLGRPQPGYIKELWAHKDAFTPFGLSFLAIAAKEDPASRPLLEPILAEVKAAAIRAKGEAYFDSTAKGGWSFDSPLRTDAGALNAYAVTNLDGAMSQELLKGLLARRNDGLWGNTQENVFGIMGIYELVSGTPAEGAASPSGLSVSINGKRFEASAFERNSMGVLRLSIPESSLGPSLSSLKAEVSSSSGLTTFVTLRAAYEVPVDTAFLAPVSRGFAYERRYSAMDGSSLDGRDIPLGSLVRVTLRIHNDAERHYVAVDDLLPAGLEPLNPKLATTQSLDLGPLSDLTLKGQSVTSYSEIRDHRVAFYADELLPGDYEFVYVARATSAGDFFLPQGRVEAMYQPDECATTGGGRVSVR